MKDILTIHGDLLSWVLLSFGVCFLLCCAGVALLWRTIRDEWR